MSCDLHTPLWVFTAPPLIPLHTLGAYLHTPSNPAPDNRKNAPPLWQRCAFVSSFTTFAIENTRFPGFGKPGILLVLSCAVIFHQTIHCQYLTVVHLHIVTSVSCALIESSIKYNYNLPSLQITYTDYNNFVRIPGTKALH